MSTAIKQGDVVRLKSGGQRMTVEYIMPGPSGTMAASVIWMTALAERKTAVIALEALDGAA